MHALLIKSDNDKTLESIKVYAKKLDAEVLEDPKILQEKETSSDESWVQKPGVQFNLKELAGSLSDLNLDATELRKQAWERTKAQF